MRRRDISSAIFASAARCAMASSPLKVQALPGHEPGKTAAEAAADVTIANPAFPPGSVDRYGSNAVPGTTSMVLAFDSAIKQAKHGGAQVTYGGTAPYLLDSPVNCTFAGRGNQHGITIRNIGDNGGDFHGIIARHTGVAVFDCTGADNVELYDVVIGTDAAVYPTTGILWARNSDGGSLFHKMQNCRIAGKFRVAPFYCYGAESDTLIDCYFANYATTAGTKAAVWTASNISGLTSIVPGLIATGPYSCIDHNCFGNQYYNEGGTDTSDCVCLEQVDSWKNFGGWAYSASLTANGRALVYVDMTRGASNFALIDGLTGENAKYIQRYGILFSNNAFTPTGWSIGSCRLPAATNAIYAGASVTLDNFHIRNISEQSSRGLLAAGTVQNSVLSTSAMRLSIVNSKNNVLMGHSEGWAVGTRHSDSWIDHGNGNKLWIANTNDLDIKGALSARAICAAHGPLVTVNIVLSASTSITCARGAVITGLPFSASDYSSDVTVTNITTQTEYAGGYIEGTKLCLPAIKVGMDKIVITATYFAA
ncbi:MAG TPA: hypothetical protein VGO37_04785 [Steroidobacteraceae bacterium]|jgi:hypothetical protein|nr:hypothetical protein [Steroidobacteraceae bacterium]